jgi:hypothetical protein
MLQGMFFYMFFKILDKSKSVKNIFGSIKLWVPVAALFFLISMTRNLALGILVPLLAFLIFRRQFIHGVAFIISFLLFRIPFEIFRRIMWGEQNQFANQMSVLIKQKDPYDVSKGVEDLNGYISRFTGNYGLYICKRFYQILGFLAEGDYQIRAGLGFVFFVLLILATIYFFRKKNDYLLFTLFYTVAMCCFTFIALQTRWDQYRFILIFVPFILILFLTAFYKSIFNNIFGRTVFLMTIIVLIFSSLITTLNKSLKSYPVVKKNFAGDIFYGYTPDWEHYLEMSKWVGDSLPNAFVACRKSPMSFIYANGKEFYPVYNVFSTDADTVLNTFKRNNVTHVILASLRRNPRVNDGTIINTVHRVIQPVAQKYPQKLSLVKQIGESEPAFLYKINY